MTAKSEPPFDRRWLAGYVDGELIPEARARVEAWLAEHPEALADLRAQQAVARANRRLWRDAAPTPPSSAAWDRVFANIEGALNRPPAPPRPRPWGVRRVLPRLMMTGVASLATAAALLMAPAPIAPPPRGGVVEDVDEAAWPVAGPDDVEIISIREEDAGMLVVGRHPVPGPIVLATATDVILINLEPDATGWVPEAHMGAAVSGVPMIYAPAGRGP